MIIDAEFLAEQKRLLEDRLAKLMSELKSEGMRTGKPEVTDATFPKYGEHEDENAAEVADYEERLSAMSTNMTSMQETKAAIERINGGTYGICEKCSNAIDPHRLRAFPSARSCMNCKKKPE